MNNQNQNSFSTNDPALAEFNNRPVPFVSRKKKMVIASVAIVLVLAILGGLAYFILARKSSAVPNKTVAQQACVSGTTLKWWVPDVPYMSSAVLMPMVAEYNKDFKDQTVNVEIVSRKYDNYEYYNNIITSMAKDAPPDSGASPDIFSIRNDDLIGYMDYITPFDSMDETAVSKYNNAFVDIVADQTVVQSKLYGVTTYVDNMQLYYNKQILDQNRLSKPAASWDEIVKQTEILTNEKQGGLGFNQSAIAMGTGNNSENISNIKYSDEIIPMLITQKGGIIYNEQTNSVSFTFDQRQGANGKNTSAFLDAINFYQQFGDDTKRGSTYTWDEYMPNSLDAFAQGQLAYILGYKEDHQLIRDKRQGLDFQVAPLPQFDEKNKSTLGKFFMNVISARLDPKAISDNPKADAVTLKNARVKKACAENLLKYIAGKKAQEMYFTATKMPPARRDIIEAQQKSNSMDALFANGSLTAVTYYKPDVLAVERMWNQMMSEIRNGVKVETAAQNASALYAQLAAQQAVPRHDSKVKPIIPGNIDLRK